MTLGHQGRDATYQWAHDQWIYLWALLHRLSMTVTCDAIKQAKQMKPLLYGEWWLKCKCEEAWQIDYITLPWFVVVEASTVWLETHPVLHVAACNTILGLKRQAPWWHGTSETTKSDNGTHFQNNLISNWAKEHGIERIYHLPYHASPSGKVEHYSGLLKTTLKAMRG